MSYFLQFLIICALVLLGSVKVTLQGAMGRRYIRCAQDSVLFNIIFFAFIACVVALFFGLSPVTPEVFLWASAVSVFTVVFQLIYSIALSIGPVSLTVLITSSSVFIATFASVIMYKEQVYLPQLIAILFLALSMVLSLKKSPDGRQISGRWLAMSFIAFFATGTATLLQKMFSVSLGEQSGGKTSSTFLFLMYLLGAAMLLIVYFVRAHTGKKEKSTAGIPRGMVLFALGMGLALGIYQKLNVFAMANIDGAFFYPTYNGLTSVLMSVIGILFFHDELNLRQRLGIVCGIVSVVLMNVRVWPI
ncbi:MAG: hypothetical protein E7632_11080 [Ruminococcaceae bacterium]|nr:hypothetical protein [Oscillospiraceae bacterium]